jgi:SAM-dependent methyltransferase
MAIWSGEAKELEKLFGVLVLSFTYSRQIYKSKTEKMNFTGQRLKTISGLLFFINIGLFGQNGISEPWEKGINERQPPTIVLKVIGVKPGMIIGEVGAGRGRYTVFLANETGKTGKVLANDIDEASLAYLRGRCRRLGINNVETVVGEMDNPLFPNNSLDMAIMVLVYHMIENPDNLLRNLKNSLKPNSRLVILDPRDEEIDREFGIDRSNPESKVLTIEERVQKSAKAAGYDLIKVDTSLPHDYIFILEPVVNVHKKSAGELIQKTLLQDGIDASIKLFNKIKNDSLHFDLSEKVFTNLGNEFIGAKSYPEAIAVLNMGIELFPKSAKLYGVIGEVYLLTREKEKARNYYKHYLENGPDSLNTKTIMQNFDAMYEQMRQQD